MFGFDKLLFVIKRIPFFPQNVQNWLQQTLCTIKLELIIIQTFNTAKTSFIYA